jgi:hypothetical protein
VPLVDPSPTWFYFPSSERPPPWVGNNEFERQFAKFLQDANDVVSFAKLPSRFAFAIEYTDSANNLRYYEPDFVAIDSDGMITSSRRRAARTSTLRTRTAPPPSGARTRRC